jgi:formate hydrogenlyase subunit 3/multisubunit Na+/H+ antiporter MnhD subunit
MASALEALMVVCFGISWPLSIYKSWNSQSTKGKSGIFLGFIILGYLAGIISKLLANNITYVFYFYLVNLVMVTADLLLFFRNTRIEKESLYQERDATREGM